MDVTELMGQTLRVNRGHFNNNLLYRNVWVQGTLLGTNTGKERSFQRRNCVTIAYVDVHNFDAIKTL